MRRARAFAGVACAIAAAGCSSTKLDRAVVSGRAAQVQAQLVRPAAPGAPVVKRDPEVEATWRDLLDGMARDPQTKKLLSRLYGGLAVHFGVVPSDPGPLAVATDKGMSYPQAAPPSEEALVAKTPPEGFEIALRAADLGGGLVYQSSWNDSRGVACGHDLALGRVSTVPRPRVAGPLAASIYYSGDIDAVRLAALDYMMRQVGWTVVAYEGGTLPVGWESAKANRAELDRRIERHVARYRWGEKDGE